MEPKVKRDILTILKQSQEDILKNDIIDLQELSNHTIHNASIYQDEFSISTAVIISSLAKVLQRTKGKLDGKITPLLKKAYTNLEYDETEKFRESLKDIIKEISKIDSQLKMYIEEVIDNSELKKAFKLYQHGLSVGKVCELLGISEWELVNYIGKTQMDYPITTKVERRLNFTRKLFNLR